MHTSCLTALRTSQRTQTLAHGRVTPQAALPVIASGAALPQHTAPSLPTTVLRALAGYRSTARLCATKSTCSRALATQAALCASSLSLATRASRCSATTRSATCLRLRTRYGRCQSQRAASNTVCPTSAGRQQQVRRTAAAYVAVCTGMTSVRVTAAHVSARGGLHTSRLSPNLVVHHSIAALLSPRCNRNHAARRRLPVQRRSHILRQQPGAVRGCRTARARSSPRCAFGARLSNRLACCGGV